MLKAQFNIITMDYFQENLHLLYLLSGGFGTET